MIHGNRQRPQPRLQKTHGELHQLGVYLIGTVGVALLLTGIVIVANRAGWIEEAQDALHQVTKNGLPSAPHLEMPDSLPGFTDNISGVGQTTNTLWQRGAEHTQPGQQPRR